MPDSLTSFPLDLSGLRDAPPEEVAPLLERAAETEDKRAIPVLTALLMNRLLRLLRLGSRQEILDEAMMVNRFLALEAGMRLQQSRPQVYGGWAALGELLSGAARSTGRAAIPALLRGTQGRGQEILKLLAAEAGPIQRSRIKKTLDLAEAQLSHLLHDLEEADLIIRYRVKGSKEVLVELGSAGREVVAQTGLSRPAPALPAPDATAEDEAPIAKVIQMEEFRKKVATLQEDGVSRLVEMDISDASLTARALFGTRATAS